MTSQFRYGSTAWGVVQVRNPATRAPVAADGGTVTAKIIGEDAQQIGSTITLTAFGAFTGAYKLSVDLNTPDFIPGIVYRVYIEYAVSTVLNKDWDTFQVT